MVLESHKSKDKEGLHGHDPFYRGSVEALNHIISSTMCEIIISSGWRRFFDLEQMQEIFQWNGIQKAPIGFVQDYRVVDGKEQLPKGKEIEMIRCREILLWLRAHDTHGRLFWCAVDDMDLSFGLDKFVRCPNTTGLAHRGVADKVIATLKGTC